MQVRSEISSDYGSIRDINVSAFANHPFSQQTEHLIVEALRDDDALAVSLVAELDGVVRGHIAFSSVTIGDAVGWFLLGPVAVDPTHQHKGIGSTLVEAGLERLRGAGAQGCVLVGDPAYYERFGFSHEPSLTCHGVPPQYVLCLPFGAAVPSGEIVHHLAFSVQP